MTGTLPPPDGVAFADDGQLEREIRRLISVYGIQSAVETGTHQGVTALALAAMVPMVYTIEMDGGLYADARERLAGVPNVRLYHGASQNVLPGLIPVIKRPVLYYLDAHWGYSYPLPAEVEIIARCDPQPVILMHDMQVPGHPDLHADQQLSGALYNFEWVRPMLEQIQGPWRYYYNDGSAEGLRVGVLFVVPDRGGDEAGPA